MSLLAQIVGSNFAHARRSTRDDHYFSHTIKKGQATRITPLQPPTLAAFPPWGDSAGAGCAELARHKYRISQVFNRIVKLNFIKYLGEKLSMYKPLFLLLLALVASTCDGEKKIKAKLKIKASTEKPSPQDTLTFSLKLPKNSVVDSIRYFSNGKAVDSPLSLESFSLGSHTLQATAFYNGKSHAFENTYWVYASEKPSLMKYRVLNSYPHDPTAYTQGLEFKGEMLYESTGLNGKSTIRKVDYKTGGVLANQKLDAVYFGEGLTLWDEQAIQLTWRANMGFVYDGETLKMTDSFAYDKSTQGWGLCHNEEQLYKSDGSHILWTLDPKSYKETGSIEVMTNTKSVNKLNELEWAQGLIYANTYQFQKDVVVIVQPETGAVVGVVDFTGLREKLRNNPKAEAFNGIAYHPQRNTFFVTGKYWNSLFEVEIYSEE